MTTSDIWLPLRPSPCWVMCYIRSRPASLCGEESLKTSHNAQSMLFLRVDLSHQLFTNTKKDFSRDCFKIKWRYWVKSRLEERSGSCSRESRAGASCSPALGKATTGSSAGAAAGAVTPPRSRESAGCGESAGRAGRKKKKKNEKTSEIEKHFLEFVFFFFFSVQIRLIDSLLCLIQVLLFLFFFFKLRGIYIYWLSCLWFSYLHSTSRRSRCFVNIKSFKGHSIQWS